MPEFPLTITAIATVILASLYLWLTAKVILHRRSERISLGDNGDKSLNKKIRGHANAAEQIPLGLILIGLNEALNGSQTAIMIAVLFCIGRIFHGAYFAILGLNHNLRAIGMALTLLAQIIGIIALAAGLIL